jgi:glutathione synthase/RimK-type ligase-like ATP-grasp enzyme
MNPLIVILTRQSYCQVAHEDDALLKSALQRLDCRVDIVAWDDATYPFETADLAIVRSCWDFHFRVDEYLRKIKNIGARVHLLNPVKYIETYCSKHYLADISAAGINTVATAFCQNLAQTLQAAANFNSRQVVLKPVVSASGDNTFCLQKNDHKALELSAAKIFQVCDELLVQPFIETVQSRGEFSSVIIDGHVRFTMRKTPAKGGFLVHEHHGGQYRKTEISQTQQDFLDQICAIFPQPPLYMRVDYLHGADGHPALLELELNEPNLYLRKSPEVLTHLSARLAEIGHKNCQDRGE